MTKRERLQFIADKYGLDTLEVGRDVRVLTICLFDDFKDRQRAINAFLKESCCTGMHFYDNSVSIELSLEEAD